MNSSTAEPSYRTDQTNLPSSSSPTPPDRPRSLEIDLLRIICATLLFYFHVGIYTHWAFSGYATFASGTFIALAGYCAVHYSRHRDGLIHPTLPSVGRYFLDRFLAVYPAYAAITLAVFAGSYLYPATGHSGPFTIRELICNLFMVNQYIGMDYFTSMMWFVPFVLQLYLLVPLLVLFARHAYGGLVVCSLFSLAACLAVYAFVPAHVGEICKDWSPLFRLAPAFLGVALGLSGSTAVLPGLLLLWIGCSAVRLTLLPWLPDLLPVLLRSLFSALLFPVLLGTAFLGAHVVRRWQLPGERLITLFSQATLPFFLGHGVMIDFLWHRMGANVAGWIAYFAFSWLWSILFTVGYVRCVRALRARFASTPLAPIPIASGAS